MSATSTPDNQSLPLTPAVFYILLALADEDRHGYSIMQRAAEAADGRVNMGPGTLYGTIKRLLAAKMIEETVERPDPTLDDERRRYYRLTATGRSALESELSRYSSTLDFARACGAIPGFAKA